MLCSQPSGGARHHVKRPWRGVQGEAFPLQPRARRNRNFAEPSDRGRTPGRIAACPGASQCRPHIVFGGVKHLPDPGKDRQTPDLPDQAARQPIGNWRPATAVIVLEAERRPFACPCIDQTEKAAAAGWKTCSISAVLARDEVGGIAQSPWVQEILGKKCQFVRTIADLRLR